MTSSAASVQLVAFTIYKQSYAIPIEQVEEIIRVTPITKVPGIPQYVAGVINLRGNIMPVIDVQIRFGLPPSSFSPRSRIIIVKLQQEPIGLLVDEIKEVAVVNLEQIDPSPDLQQYVDEKYLTGFAKTDFGIVGIFKLEVLGYGA